MAYRSLQHADVPLAMLIDTARRAVRSPSLRSAAFLAAGGGGFAAGNLLLARLLAPAEFGKVSLLLSLIQVGAALGAPALPLLVNRHRLGPSAALLRRPLLGGLLAGSIVGLLALQLDALDWSLAVVLGASIALAAAGRVAAALFQARQHLITALFLTQIHNWLLLASVPLVLLWQRPRALAVALFVLCGYAVTTVAGWQWAWRRLASHAPLPPPPLRQLSEGLGAAGLALAINVLFQLDRLVIGALLSVQELAAYSIVATVAGSAFRMLQVGAGHSLVPRLRACERRQDAVRLLRGEGMLLAGAGIVAAGLILLLMPWLTEHFLAGRYAVPAGLAGTVIVIGFVRTWEASATAVVNALGSPRELLALTLLAWFAVAAGTAGAAWTSRFGLLEVVYSLGIAWSMVALGASALALQALARLR